MELEVCGLDDIEEKVVTTNITPYFNAIAPQVFMMMTEEISLVY